MLAKTNRQNVSQDHNKGQAGHEGGKTKSDVRGNVFFPKRRRGLGKSPTGKECDGCKGWQEHDEAQSRTDNLSVNGMNDGF